MKKGIQTLWSKERREKQKAIWRLKKLSKTEAWVNARDVGKCVDHQVSAGEISISEELKVSLGDMVTIPQVLMYQDHTDTSSNGGKAIIEGF